jgi:6-phosphogluconolactonase
MVYLASIDSGLRTSTNPNMLPSVHVSSTQADLTQAAAAHVAQLAEEAVRARGRFTVAFSGGSLPRLLCPGLTTKPLRSRIDWPAWRVFWADERCVPGSDARSSHGALRYLLLDCVAIVPQQIYALDDSLVQDPDAAAVAYQSALLRILRPRAGEAPRFDLILLGLGEDGHTASLFPSHPLLRETERWVASVVDSPKPPPERITLTLPVLNNARDIVFIAAGVGKADALASVLAKDQATDVLPARLVQPRDGGVTWFVDGPAASKLGEGVDHVARG